MGNRAVLVMDDYHEDAIGIYLQWNGGRDSVEAFLQATREVMQGRLGDKQYARARLMQVIGTALPGNLSFGLGRCGELDCDNFDNGTYVIDSATMTIKDRLFFDGRDEQMEYDADEFSAQIMKGIHASAAAYNASDD